MDRRYVALGCEYLALSLAEFGNYMPLLVDSFTKQNTMITALMLIYDADIGDCTTNQLVTLLLLEGCYQRDLARTEKIQCTIRRETKK
jgi:hypothetical protein